MHPYRNMSPTVIYSPGSEGHRGRGVSLPRSQWNPKEAIFPKSILVTLEKTFGSTFSFFSLPCLLFFFRLGLSFFSHAICKSYTNKKDHSELSHITIMGSGDVYVTVKYVCMYMHRLLLQTDQGWIQ